MLIYWLIYILAEALVQARLIKKGIKPIYIVLFITRGIASIIFGIFLDVTQDQALLYYGFLCTSFWVIFDVILNKLRGKSLIYKGRDSGWLDKLPYWAYIPLKLISLGLGIAFYIKSLYLWPL